MSTFDWRTALNDWCITHQEFPDDWKSTLIELFSLSFQNTQTPNRAWFGLHRSAASLVLGGIFLVACYRKRKQWVISLLADQNPPVIEGLQYAPVKSTVTSPYPLLWADTTSLATMRSLLFHERFWESFQAATSKIVYAIKIASDRDDVQLRRGKQRLSDFWSTDDSGSVFPDELPLDERFREGAVRKVSVNAYERDERARAACISYFGRRCSVCTFSFGETYGLLAEQIIHVHHLRPLSNIGEEYIVNPIEDLRPVCPNCHAVLHLRKPTPYSIDELKDILRGQVIRAVTPNSQHDGGSD